MSRRSNCQSQPVFDLPTCPDFDIPRSVKQTFNMVDVWVATMSEGFAKDIEATAQTVIRATGQQMKDIARSIYCPCDATKRTLQEHIKKKHDPLVMCSLCWTRPKYIFYVPSSCPFVGAEGDDGGVLGAILCPPCLEKFLRKGFRTALSELRIKCRTSKRILVSGDDIKYCPT
ncbi:hypothetical protein BDN72DRAFT_903594 [Pluteus cervinus]|uniref:Uncharacterized protein n=1 Tax=Pluteus cervinus TaxID=181527 RepID=A0ACD3A812_9AGAR|nr:hypothetical protein BDN72DRAFT_903594 [Pluteus cervinus]